MDCFWLLSHHIERSYLKSGNQPGISGKDKRLYWLVFQGWISLFSYLCLLPSQWTNSLVIPWKTTSLPLLCSCLSLWSALSWQREKTQMVPLLPVKTLLVFIMISVFSHFSSIKTHYCLFFRLIWQIVKMETAIVGGKIKTGEKDTTVIQISVYILFS